MRRIKKDDEAKRRAALEKFVARLELRFVQRHDSRSPCCLTTERYDWPATNSGAADTRTMVILIWPDWRWDAYLGTCSLSYARAETELKAMVRVAL